MCYKCVIKLLHLKYPSKSSIEQLNQPLNEYIYRPHIYTYIHLITILGSPLSKELGVMARLLSSMVSIWIWWRAIFISNYEGGGCRTPLHSSQSAHVFSLPCFSFYRHATLYLFSSFHIYFYFSLPHFRPIKHLFLNFFLLSSSLFLSQTVLPNFLLPSFFSFSLLTFILIFIAPPFFLSYFLAFSLFL